jgi:Spy/CpxP family protein refolding chaperone
MKKLFCSLCLVLTFMMLVVNMQAQPPQGPPPPPTAEQRAEHLNKLAKDLKLTDDQKAKFKQAEDNFFAKAEKLHEEGKPKMDALHQERDETVKAILTTEQYAQLKKMEAERRKQGPPRKKKED